MFRNRFAIAITAALAVASTTARSAEMTQGTPDIKSAGSMAFGPDGILFVGDAQGASIFAIDTNDKAADTSGGTFKVEGIGEKLAAMLGTEAANVTINDLAVNPASGKAYLSITRGKGAEASPVIARVDRSGKIEIVSLKAVSYAKASLTDAPAPGGAAKRGPSPRSQAITDLAYVDGRVYVAGLSNEKFSSRLISIPYPFASTESSTSVEIYHGAHGAFETTSPIRTFAAYKIKGEPYLMAAYTCTPLVKVPVAALKPGTHYKGTTIAELGNRNQPLDMIVYQKDGKDFILMANSSRGMMKVSTDGIDEAASITKRISDTAGQPYEKLDQIKGVVQLDTLDKDNALILVQQPGGALNLETLTLP